MADDQKKLPAAEPVEELQSGEDLALSALAQSSEGASTAGATDETLQSDQLADTLSHLQSILERYATELERISKEIKEKRESIQAVMMNDSTLSEAEDQAQAANKQAKERKTQLQSNPEVVAAKNQIGDLTQQRKEVEETISNHLLNYYKITNSKSFDTSDGDQWDFDIHAKVKPRRKS